MRVAELDWSARGREPVFNFEVEWLHEYRVGGVGVRSHNSKVCVDYTAELSRTGDDARKQLRKALNSNGTGLEAHHIIPWGKSTREHPLVQLAARGGFNFNGVQNGMLMTKLQHRGLRTYHHNRYNTAVRIRMDFIARNTPNATPAQAARLLTDYTAKLRKGINRSGAQLR